MSQTTQLLDITSHVQQESEASKNEGTYIIHTYYILLHFRMN